MAVISAVKSSWWARAAASVSLVALALAGAPHVAQARAQGQVQVQVPGTPGVPQAPVTVFVEDFEKAGDSPVFLEKYVGAPPLNETYTADPPWLDHGQCNGIILSRAGADQPGCRWVSYLKDMADALGQVGGTNPPANHAVSAYSDTVDPGVDRVEFRTEQQIPIPIAKPNRYITFAVDVAADNCRYENPLLKFYLTGSGPDIPTFTTPINPCTDPKAKPYSGGMGGLMAGSYAGDRAVLFGGTELGIKMLNGQGHAFGNDHAFDNIRILDATPQLDKAFGPDTIDQGGISTLTMTVTNTSELAAKNDFGFTDSLPAGVTVASNASASTTCGNGTVSAAAGGSSVALAGGDLAAGQKSCTVTVNVTAGEVGTHVNRPDAITTIGLDLPAAATLTVNSESGAVGTATGSPGLLSGNVVQVPLDLPVNACGNTVNVVGLLNPAAGNTCANR
ncbi:chaplin [Streptomyces sp. NPDC054833]